MDIRVASMFLVEDHSSITKNVATRSLETSVKVYRTAGITFQTTAIFIVDAVRTPGLLLTEQHTGTHMYQTVLFSVGRDTVLQYRLSHTSHYSSLLLSSAPIRSC
jgi:hypothetical protein